jgi:NCS1 family nucleobase:cation symporter-1
MIVDYFFIRNKELNAADLYKEKGEYTYSNGFNTKAILALLVGILPNIPGFLLQIKVIAADAFPQWVNHLYNYAWFVGFAVSGVVYYLLMKKK